jgi:hypothetical protein
VVALQFAGAVLGEDIGRNGRNRKITERVTRSGYFLKEVPSSPKILFVDPELGGISQFR